MTSIPPPDGLTGTDYESIEAAVTETVRGRWFLAEFARRIRSGEHQELLDGMARLETMMRTGLTQAPQPADPSIRLILQRIKEISGQLGETAQDMRAAGIENGLCDAIGLQARAVAGLMRTNAAPPLPLANPPKRADLGLDNPLPPKAALPVRADAPASDPRLDVLSRLDRLSLVQKAAFFT